VSIVAHDLRKHFTHRPAVDGVSFEVRDGEIYGLLGPNGAGKTTTLRMLAGLMRPDSGRALVAGHDMHREQRQAKAALGFTTGTTGLYERLSPTEVLAYFGRLYGLDEQLLSRRIEELTRVLGLGSLLHRRCGSLSTGERQRVSLARALIHDPAVLILDEPTAGLDVLASRFVAGVVREARDRGKAVLLSTHYMAEAELLCDRVGLLHQGRLLWEGSPDELKQQQQARSLEEAFLQLISVGA